MTNAAKPTLQGDRQKILTIETMAFLLIILLIWMNEILDIPFYLGAPQTPINWREALVETFGVLILAVYSIFNTKRLMERTKVLEGILPICSCCKKIRDEKNQWRPIESYVCERSQAEFSHSLCQECVKKLYPEFMNAENISEASGNSLDGSNK